MVRQIVLDTETTGLSPKSGHRIIEIGCIEMTERQLTKNHWHQYINPEREIDAGAMRVHGITNEFVSAKPLFKEIIEAFIEFVRGAELIIHNAPFDVGFLNHEFKLCGKKYGCIEDYCRITDTLTIARNKHMGQKNSLDALCQRYGVDNSNREYHGALLDSELLAQVYLYMTGGQKLLFAQDDTKSDGESVLFDSRPVDLDRGALLVVEPSEDELKSHQQYLEAMGEKGTSPLWEKAS
jgi:DNA polymerase III subunit epsilon